MAYKVNRIPTVSKITILLIESETKWVPLIYNCCSVSLIHVTHGFLLFWSLDAVWKKHVSSALSPYLTWSLSTLFRVCVYLICALKCIMISCWLWLYWSPDADRRQLLPSLSPSISVPPCICHLSVVWITLFAHKMNCLKWQINELECSYVSVCLPLFCLLGGRSLWSRFTWCSTWWKSPQFN